MRFRHRKPNDVVINVTTPDPAAAAEKVNNAIRRHVAGRDWVPDHWLIITKRRFRWHWELRNLAAYPWASGTARTFAQAREAGRVRAKVGPTGPLPTRPDPTIPEAWPRTNYLPIKAADPHG